MTNSNLQTVVIRLAFRKGSDEISAGLTKNNNVTLVGEILHSSDLTVSHYNKLFNVDGASCVGSVGTVCISDREVADALIEEINSIQVARPVNARGNKYPFVFIRVVTDGDVIFNKGVGSEAHRLSFLDVECVEVEAEAPDEVVRIATSQVPANNSRSAYGTVKYRPQVKAARAGLSSQMEASVQRTPSPQEVVTPATSFVVDEATPSAQTEAPLSSEMEAVSKAEATPASKHNLSPADRLAILGAGFTSKDIEDMSEEQIARAIKLVSNSVIA